MSWWTCQGSHLWNIWFDDCMKIDLACCRQKYLWFGHTQATVSILVTIFNRHIYSERESYRERESEREWESERVRESERERVRESEREWERVRESEREWERVRESEREWERVRERGRERGRQTEISWSNVLTCWDSAYIWYKIMFCSVYSQYYNAKYHCPEYVLFLY